MLLSRLQRQQRAARVVARIDHLRVVAAEDFDPDADASLIDRVVSDHGDAEGIRQTVHRICLVARKTS